MRNLLRVWAFVGTQLIVSAPAIAEAPDTLWTKTYGGTSYDFGYSVQECTGGGFIIAGETGSFDASSQQDVYLIRTNADGDTLWTKTYGETGFDWGNSVQQCAGGGFIIAGMTESFGAGGKDVYLIRTDLDGDTLWTKTYGGTSSDYGWSVQECAEGGFIIAGGTKSFGAGGYDVYLIRTNVDGDTLWTKTYGGAPYDWGKSVQECAGGGFIITGETGSFGAGGYDVYLIRTDSDGDTLWTKTYGGTFYDGGSSVEECASGDFIIAGTTISFDTGEDVYLIRTDADGDTLWTKTYGGTSNDKGYSVQECVSGGFIIAGETRSFSAGKSDVYLIRISETGVEERNERLEIRDWRLEIYPNPSTTGVKVQWLGVSEGQKISLKVYDLGGRLVKTLLNNEIISGNKIEVRLEELAKGIYFVKMEAGDYKATKKLMILI